jgi:hypothetical protein
MAALPDDPLLMQRRLDLLVQRRAQLSTQYSNAMNELASIEFEIEEIQWKARKMGKEITWY